MGFVNGRASHLHAVPDSQPSPMERYWDSFNKTLSTLHIFNGIGRAERQVKHLIEQAREAELSEAAECLTTALTSLQDAKAALK